MKKPIPIIWVILLICHFASAQTPVHMASQSGFSYTENFSDIANWGNGFTSGIGADPFGVVAVSAVGSIPSATKTTVSSATFSTGSSGGVQKGNQAILLLTTGTTNNTTSLAIDFLMDFTGVNANKLSFDWAEINNSTGNRAGSLRVYTSTDGTNFTELTNAAVLNFANNSGVSGSITNIDLPAAFNNNPNARLRFYYYNGTGGSTGSRPKISIDNLTVTATGSICSSPAAQPTALNFNTATATAIAADFTAASPTADEYLVVMSNNSSLTSNPVDGLAYNVGDGLGDGTVVSKGSSTSFNVTNLSASTQYYFFVYAINSYCSGGPLYATANFLTGNTTTAAGLPNCTAPADQASNLNFGTTTSNTIQGSFQPGASNENLVIISTAATLNATPVNGQQYITGDSIGNGIVVQSGLNTAFTADGLLANTNYYFYTFSFNQQSCLFGPAYNTNSPLTGTKATTALPACTTPLTQPTNITLAATNNSINISFTASATADWFVVVQSTSPTLSATPTNNTDYSIGNALGGGTVVSSSAVNSFDVSNLNAATTYYYFVFAANKSCSGGTKYLTTPPLTGNATTSSSATNNYYFGNLHSHSDYSDGNKDNPGYTPANDYLYALSSQCMDYLGISEHNHYSSNNNPGNSITNYHQGSIQANSFTASHPGFVAMYGMEWGVISGGGHVVIYGDGMDDLFGWETGSGGWGSSNNYDVYVAKSDYTGANGLFKTINDRIAQNTFATLAHPNATDFNNIAGTAYNNIADNAIVGTAVESGPAFSTNTTYSNPGASMSYLSYYQSLLSKGYHLGPTIDHDNHNTTFGRTTHSRTAILAPELTRTALVNAMRQMHFYATEDCDTKVDFAINTNMMGSNVTDRFAPNITVTLSDATTSLTSAHINLMYGNPGSGILPVKIYTATGSTLNFTDNNLENYATGYYYIDITNGSSRIVTSPIWYTRQDNGTLLPIKLISFAAQKENDKVELLWSTAQETNNKFFIIERSVDGKNWQAFTTVAATNSNLQQHYTTYDYNPANGINYYRLKQVDTDDKSSYSTVKTILFSTTYRITVAPNPAKDFIHVYINNNAARTVNIVLIDALGNIVKTIRTNLSSNSISTAGLTKGLYFVKLFDDENSTVVKVVLQ
jgi:hypothetical protein